MVEKRVKSKEERKLDKLHEEINKILEEKEKIKADMEHWKNEYYRAYADTKNLRNKIEEDYHNALKYRSEGFIGELLPILDSFYMVLANEPEDPNLKNYLVGFQYIYKNLVSVLESEGVSEITPEIGGTFDPHTMSAVDTVEGEDNKITKIYTKGYKLHDRLIRPAGVQVSVKKTEEESEKNEEHIDA